MRGKFRFLYMNFVSIAKLDFPFIFIVKVMGFCLRLLFPTSRCLLSYLFHDPGLEFEVKQPTSLFELLCRKILLVSTRLIIKGKEKTLSIHSLKVALPIIHWHCREISIYLLLLHKFFLLLIIYKKSIIHI